MSDYKKKPRLRVYIYLLTIKHCLSLYILLGFLCCLCALPLFGQLDSLEQHLLTLPESTEKVDLLNKLSYGYHRKDVEQTFTYANQALKLATTLNYIKGKAFAHHYLSIGNAISGDSELAKKLNKRVIHLADSLQAYDLLVSALNMKAFNFTKDGKPVEAMKAFQQALDLASQENDKIGYSSIALNLGEVNAQNKDFEKARAYYNKALAVSEEINEPARIAWANRLIGDTYAEEKNYTEAAFFFKEAIKKAIVAKDNRSLSFAKSRLGKVSMELGQIELAEKEIKEAIQLIQEVGDKEGLMDGYIILMKIYLKRNQSNNVIHIGQKATKLTTQVNSVQQQLELQGLLAKAYAIENDFQKAYQLNLFTQEIKDSIDFVNKKNLASELEEKYQSKKKEAENALLRIEKQQQVTQIKQQQSINIFLAIVAVLLALLGYMAFNAYKNKRRNNLVLEEKVTNRTQELQSTNTQLLQSNEELARFAYVASHDLREPLRNIINFTQLLQKQLAPTQAQESLQMIDIIHENTTHMNKLIVDTLTFTRLSNIEEVREPVDLNQTIKNIKLAISTTLTKKNATIDLLKPLPTVQTNGRLLFSVFKNLIENGITYNESTTRTIVIDHFLKGQNYVFSVADNGIGIPEAYQATVFEMFKRLQNREKYQGTGMGLSNCKKIIDTLGGEIWVESDGQNGATFFFTIPASAVDTPAKKENKLRYSPVIST